MAKIPVERWRGFKELGESLKALEDALKTRVPEDIAVAMANLQGHIDWFQVGNEIELDPQRIEAEYNRLDEKFDEVTLPEWPVMSLKGQDGLRQS